MNKLFTGVALTLALQFPGIEDPNPATFAGRNPVLWGVFAFGLILGFWVLSKSIGRDLDNLGSGGSRISGVVALTVVAVVIVGFIYFAKSLGFGS